MLMQERKMTHGSLFSGVGGFDLAAEWCGWTNLFHCENNPFSQKILKHHFPHAKSHSDINTTDFSVYRGTVDVLSGGFPCQPYSTAGKRLGKADERHLWLHMLRAIRECKPKWVVGENVRGLISWNGGMVFDEVQADLEAEGYEVLPFLLPACAVNAPHRRERIWFIAYSRDNGPHGSEIRQGLETGNGGYATRENQAIKSEGRSLQDAESAFNTQFATNGGHNAAAGGGTGLHMVGDIMDKARRDESSNNRDGAAGQQEPQPRAGQGLPGCNNAGNYWDNWPTQPPLCSRNDGLPAGLAGITFSKHRTESLKAYGNAVVPQVAYQIFQAVDWYDFVY